MIVESGGDAYVDSGVKFAVVCGVSVVVFFAASPVGGVGIAWSATAVGVESVTSFGVVSGGVACASGMLVGVAMGVDV